MAQHQMSDGGKGSAPRPIEVPKDEFNRRWEETFGKQKVKETIVPLDDPEFQAFQLKREKK